MIRLALDETAAAPERPPLADGPEATPAEAIPARAPGPADVSAIIGDSAGRLARALGAVVWPGVPAQWGWAIAEGLGYLAGYGSVGWRLVEPGAPGAWPGLMPVIVSASARREVTVTDLNTDRVEKRSRVMARRDVAWIPRRLVELGQSVDDLASRVAHLRMAVDRSAGLPAFALVPTSLPLSDAQRQALREGLRHADGDVRVVRHPAGMASGWSAGRQVGEWVPQRVAPAVDATLAAQLVAACDRLDAAVGAPPVASSREVWLSWLVTTVRPLVGLAADAVEPLVTPAARRLGRPVGQLVLRPDVAALRLDSQALARAERARVEALALADEKKQHANDPAYDYVRGAR